MGFSSQRCNINVVKGGLMKMRQICTKFVVKRNDRMLCVKINKLKLIDIDLYFYHSRLQLHFLLEGLWHQRKERFVSLRVDGQPN